MRRVVVTGIGIVSCLGNNQNEVYQSLLNSKSGISFSEEYKEYGIHFNSLALGSVQTKMLKKAFPGFQATTSAKDMAKYIYNFAMEGYKLINGKVISISSTTP